MTERLLEQRVKAAFIYRFTDFVVWPEAAFAAPDAPFSIAVVAKEGGLADDLRQIVEGRTAAGRRIAVRQVSDNGRVQPAHIVFVADSERHRIGQLVRAAPAHALIVTETPDALSQGSVVNFVIVDGRVRFDISLTAAERRGLRLSSRLLAVAHTVRPGGH